MCLIGVLNSITWKPGKSKCKPGSVIYTVPLYNSRDKSHVPDNILLSVLLSGKMKVKRVDTSHDAFVQTIVTELSLKDATILKH